MAPPATSSIQPSAQSLLHHQKRRHLLASSRRI
ncbi:uncharacterized protein G2W53_004879 [Senna tora]|uniref:Uncharacterized protein n=1 Tax=Senna tora TaxID=362788 RepID=A0A835CIK1_9FABA|nr:uncharacterized protein G2W53_004879 [Senna tora]